MPTITKQIRIPLPPKGLSPQKRGEHWSIKRNAAKEYKADVLASLFQQWRGQRFCFSKIEISYELFCGHIRNSKGRIIPDGCYRPRDKDNAIAALKYAQDALVAFAIVQDDNSRNVSLGTVEIRSEIQSRGKRYVVMTIQGVV